jgi:hypothetical protein
MARLASPQPRRDQNALLQAAWPARRIANLRALVNQAQNPCGSPQLLLANRYAHDDPHRIVFANITGHNAVLGLCNKARGLSR